MNMHKTTKEKFIKNYLSEHKCVDIMNANFVNEYIKQFNPKTKFQWFGAQGCPEIGKLLSNMYRSGTLKRSIIGLHQMGIGYPKWVYVYELTTSYPYFYPAPLAVEQLPSYP